MSDGCPFYLLTLFSTHASCASLLEVPPEAQAEEQHTEGLTLRSSSIWLGFGMVFGFFETIVCFIMFYLVLKKSCFDSSLFPGFSSIPTFVRLVLYRLAISVLL